MNSRIIMYTDGSSRGNPGPGGYGTLLQLGQYKRKFSAGFAKTTNNRMELLAVIIGLEALKNPNSTVTVYSDSKYVVDSVEKKWVFNWFKNKFKGKKNSDLWIRFLHVYSKHEVNFVWVKGHANIIGNEICDKLAVEASFGVNLPEDKGYINSLI